ncbi:MAG TPA: type II toxin-antitoxin system VapC family toxin [Mycobacteriales bacterium]
MTPGPGGYCVIDAGALVEILLGTMRAEAVRTTVEDRRLVAPAVIDAEILSALRGLERNRSITPDRAALAVEDLRVAPVERFGLEPLLRRAWTLRDRLHAYDALYVALAVELDCPLITTDDQIGRSRLPATVIHA